MEKMISHKHKFIFIHIPKTGGTSIERRFVPFAGHDEHEVSYKHDSAIQMKQKFSQEWKDYFKFSIVRNPWDWLVSRFFWSKQRDTIKETCSFKKFIVIIGNLEMPDFFFTDCISNMHDKEGVTGGKTASEINWQYLDGFEAFKDICDENKSKFLIRSLRSQLDMIRDPSENFLVDFVGKIENLQQDFDTICEKIGVDKKNLRHTTKSNHKNYRQYYDNETRDIVAELYSKDIKYFGYKFHE